MGMFDKLLETVDHQKWLDPLADRLEKIVKALFKAGGAPGQAIANLLHGTWLGHPVHPLLTDIPIGAWSVTLILDSIGALRTSPAFETGADGALAIGLVGAAGAALSGLADWHHTYPAGPRRMGLAHGLLNLAAIALYSASLVFRLEGQRGSGVVLAYLGYGALAVSGYLGGHLAHALTVGANQALETPELQPDHATYVPVLAEKDLEEGKLTRAMIDRFPILLVRQGSTIYALAELCSHLGCSLVDEGKLEGDTHRCTCHGSRFALRDGRILNGPASSPQPRLDVRVREGKIEVRGGPEAWSAVVPRNSKT